eukprot:gene27782-27670_t
MEGPQHGHPSTRGRARAGAPACELLSVEVLQNAEGADPTAAPTPRYVVAAVLRIAAGSPDGVRPPGGDDAARCEVTRRRRALLPAAAALAWSAAGSGGDAGGGGAGTLVSHVAGDDRLRGAAAAAPLLRGDELTQLASK